MGALRAAKHGAATIAECEALAAVYAYERVESKRRGKKFYASYTWRMIKKHGVIEAVDRVVRRKRETIGFAALAEMGLLDMAFESVVMRHPEVFSKEAVSRSSERLQRMESGGLQGYQGPTERVAFSFLSAPGVLRSCPVSDRNGPGAVLQRPVLDKRLGLTLETWPVYDS